jgi:glycosyltransferase involved in cell wall biosynthesis
MTDVTVLMPVFNGEKFLRQSIQSILDQSFVDFEFLIINDGSTDNTDFIVTGFKDDRIRYITNKTNQGLVNTLNMGIRLANGQFIARMDADDIAYPDRILKQYLYLKEKPEIDVLGCHIDLVDERGELIRERLYSVQHDHIKLDSLFFCPMPHPGVIFRKDKLMDNDLFYDVNQHYTEDFELWQRALSILTFANVNEKLLQYRVSPNQVSAVFAAQQEKETRNIRLNYLIKLNLTDQDKYKQDFFLEFIDGRLQIDDKVSPQLLFSIIDTVLLANQQYSLFDIGLFNELITKNLDRMVKFYTARDNKLFSHYKRHQLYDISGLKLRDKIKLTWKEWRF